MGHVSVVRALVAAVILAVSLSPIASVAPAYPACSLPSEPSCLCAIAAVVSVSCSSVSRAPRCVAYILFIGIRTLCDNVTRGYGDHSYICLIGVRALWLNVALCLKLLFALGSFRVSGFWVLGSSSQGLGSRAWCRATCSLEHLPSVLPPRCAVPGSSRTVFSRIGARQRR
jgi:Na+-driven multidrug efflux pump